MSRAGTITSFASSELVVLPRSNGNLRDGWVVREWEVAPRMFAYRVSIPGPKMERITSGEARHVVKSQSRPRMARAEMV